MRIDSILIEDRIKEKILSQHGVEAKEIEATLFDRALFLKSRESRYIAIGHYVRYLTVVFEMQGKNAFIITAYPSSEAQIKLYKRKK